jgi:hypothetical protein
MTTRDANEVVTLLGRVPIRADVASFKKMVFEFSYKNYRLNTTEQLSVPQILTSKHSISNQHPFDLKFTSQ